MRGYESSNANKVMTGATRWATCTAGRSYASSGNSNTVSISRLPYYIGRPWRVISSLALFGCGYAMLRRGIGS